ncbi:MAG: hypothetical protein QOC63_5432, partial [Mycobacterium sp.]|nr:hypothetical protein [Mycobacterium sp.]
MPMGSREAPGLRQSPSGGAALLSGQ